MILLENPFFRGFRERGGDLTCIYTFYQDYGMIDFIYFYQLFYNQNYYELKPYFNFY